MSNWDYKLVIGLKIDSKEVAGGSCVSVRRKEVRSGRIICRGSWMKKMIGIIMWRKTRYISSLCKERGDAVEGPVVCVGREEML